jgi:transposase
MSSKDLDLWRVSRSRAGPEEFLNLIENAIRPNALEKTNSLSIGHPEAGERSAVIYTLPGSCRRHGINPFDYLKGLSIRLPVIKN